MELPSRVVYSASGPGQQYPVAQAFVVRARAAPNPPYNKCRPYLFSCLRLALTIHLLLLSFSCLFYLLRDRRSRAELFYHFLWRPSPVHVLLSLSFCLAHSFFISLVCFALSLVCFAAVRSTLVSSSFFSPRCQPAASSPSTPLSWPAPLLAQSPPAAPIASGPRSKPPPACPVTQGRRRPRPPRQSRQSRRAPSSRSPCTTPRASPPCRGTRSEALTRGPWPPLPPARDLPFAARFGELSSRSCSLCYLGVRRADMVLLSHCCRYLLLCDFFIIFFGK